MSSGAAIYALLPEWLNMVKKLSIKRRIIRAGTITILGSGVSLILSLGVRMAIARIYGPKGLGEYAGFMMFLSLFGTIAAFSLPRAVLKFAAEYEENNQPKNVKKLFSSVFFFLTGTCLIVAVLSLLFTPHLAGLIHLQTTPVLSLLLGLTLLLATYSVLASTLFLGLLQNLRAFAVSIVSLIVMVALAGYAYLVSPFPVYLLLVAGYLVSAAVGMILAIRQGLLGFEFSGREIKKAFRFALPLMLTAYLAFFVEWFDRFTLGMYFGQTEMGLFTAGLAIFVAARRLPMSLTGVLVPSYSKISLRGEEVLSRAYGKNIYYYALIFFFISGVLILFHRELITIMYTEEFLPAADILLILGGSFVLSVITNPGSSLLIGCGYTKLNTVNYTVGVGVLVPALLIFSRWGIRGAATAQILCHAVTTAGMIFILTRVIRLKIPFKPLLKLFFFTLLTGLLTGVVKMVLPFFVSLPFFFIIYAGGVWLVVLTGDDKEYLKEIWLKIKTGNRMLREPGVDWEEEPVNGEGPSLLS